MYEYFITPYVNKLLMFCVSFSKRNHLIILLTWISISSDGRQQVNWFEMFPLSWLHVAARSCQKQVSDLQWLHIFTFKSVCVSTMNPARVLRANGIFLNSCQLPLLCSDSYILHLSKLKVSNPRTTDSLQEDIAHHHSTVDIVTEVQTAWGCTVSATVIFCTIVHS